MMRKFAIILCLLFPATSAFAEDTQSLENETQTIDRSFVKKRYNIQGSAKIETVKGVNHLVFSEDFKTKNGPDLKVYLSKKSINALSSQEVDGSALKISVLKSHQGSQSYRLPADLDLADFESVIIQCEAYSVLWGGFDL